MSPQGHNVVRTLEQVRETIAVAIREREARGNGRDSGEDTGKLRALRISLTISSRVSLCVYDVQEYGLALHQCFGRYIQWVEGEMGNSVTASFKEQYFGAGEGDERKQTTLTVR